MDRVRYFLNLINNSSKLGYKQQSLNNIFELYSKNPDISDAELSILLERHKKNVIIRNSIGLSGTGLTMFVFLNNLTKMEVINFPFSLAMNSGFVTLSGIGMCFFMYNFYSKYNSYNESIKLLRLNET